MRSVFRSEGHFLDVLAETWHVYLASAVFHVFLFGFLLALLGVCCFHPSVYTLYSSFIEYVNLASLSPRYMGLVGALVEAFRPIDLWAPLRPNTNEEALNDALFSTEGLGLVHAFDRPAFLLNSIFSHQSY